MNTQDKLIEILFTAGIVFQLKSSPMPFGCVSGFRSACTW